jgi:phage-related protein
MASVGAGVVELRVHTGGEYRVLYLARYREAVYVLHAFAKKRQRTRTGDLEIARRNLAEVSRLRERTQ